MLRRRRLLTHALGLGALAAVGAPFAQGTRARPTVVVVGGGYGGATAAKYLRLLSDRTIDVVLVEPHLALESPPLSNLVVAGVQDLASITPSYAALRERWGIRIVHDRATSIDAQKRRVGLARGAPLGYDKLVLSPGIDFAFAAIEGLDAARRSGRVLQAWQGGDEVAALRAQIESIRDGGVFAITVPEVPLRCPAAPYERACLVADYFQRSKPRSKVLVLDANDDVAALPTLFRKAWSELYPGTVEYRALHVPISLDERTSTIRFEVQEDVTADVLNVLPPMRAGAIAADAGLARVNGRWCGVDFRSFESTVAKDVHVIGDSIQTASGMPKSGSMAHSHGRVAAAAIVAELSGTAALDRQAMLRSTCYSFTSRDEAIHISSVHAYDPAQATFTVVAGAGGASPVRSKSDAGDARTWARDVWADMLG